MKQQEQERTLRKTIGYAIAFFIAGVGMILFPDAIESTTASPSGRRAGLMTLLMFIWGIPGGIACLAVSAFNIYLTTLVKKG